MAAATAPRHFVANIGLKTLVSSPLMSLLLSQLPLARRFWIGLLLDEAVRAMVNALFARFVPWREAKKEVVRFSQDSHNTIIKKLHGQVI
jgi:Na+-driven multidrug efflux pump